MSLAELVNLQTQQMQMMQYEEVTQDRWLPAADHNIPPSNARNDNTSKASSYQTIGIPASAQFHMTGTLGEQYVTNHDLKMADLEEKKRTDDDSQALQDKSSF